MTTFFTKKNALVGSIVLVVASLFVGYAIDRGVCDAFLDECLAIYYTGYFLAIVGMGWSIFMACQNQKDFLPSLLHFSYGWIPFSIWLMWAFRGGYFFDPGPRNTFIFTSTTFVLFSISLFAIKSWEFRRAEAGRSLTPWTLWTVLTLAFFTSAWLAIYVIYPMVR